MKVRKLFMGKSCTEGWTTTITRHTKHKQLQIGNSGSAKMKKNGFFSPILVQRKTPVNMQFEFLLETYICRT